MSQRKSSNNEKLRYLIAGGYNTVFGYATFATLYALFYPAWHYLVIAVVSHVIAVTNAYISYKLFVFRVRGASLAEYFRFNTIYLGVLAFTVVMLPVLIEILRLHALVAQVIVVVITVIASYLLHRRYSFRTALK